MKKLILLLLIPILGLIISSCNSEDNPTTPAVTTGSVYITSDPAGAQIWIDGTNTLQTTPDTVKDVAEGTRNIKLSLTDYKDTTFTLSVTAGQISVIGPITMVSDINTMLYGPVKIYETAGTTTSQPSGLDLSAGVAYGVGASSSQRDSVDIYYSSDGYLVQSADLYTGLIRVTKFYVGSSDDIYDGIDSPNKSTGTWTDNMNDREANYVFLYDHDGHYSKLIITGWGGGVPGEPAWVQVQWYYNQTRLDQRFK